MTTAAQIIGAVEQCVGVVKAELDEVDRPLSTVYLKVTMAVQFDGALEDLKQVVMKTAYDNVAAGVALDFRWEVMGVDWADPVDQKLRERIRQKILEKYPAVGDGIKSRGLGGPW